MTKEIEVLYTCLSEAEEAIEAFQDLEFLGSKRVIDRYYFDPLRETLKPNSNGKILSCFRIREKGDTTYLTYKNDHYEGDEWQYSDEYETEVLSLKNTLTIVERLGFETLVTVDNTKHTFINELYEVVVEEVAGLGVFVEVEARLVPSEDNHKIVKDKIRKFLVGRGLKLGEEQNAGKPELLLKQHQN